MLIDFISFLKTILLSAFDMLNTSSVWMVLSFIMAGILHEFLTPEKMQKGALGSSKVSGVFYSTLTGMLIPICSCGTIPLGISLYYSGAYLGPTLAFMTASPMINPIAIILSWGLLGRDITLIYVATGFIAPMIIGMFANRFGGDELHIPLNNDEDEIRSISLLEEDEISVKEKILSGLHWSFSELAITVSKYAVTGMLAAALIFNVFPSTAIQNYLGNPGFISLLGITGVAAMMYVCAVGHIPFIAALIAGGAAPGVAITFLMAGAATNIPELITISKTIGKRAMLMYLVLVTGISNIVGFMTNKLLMPGFEPIISFDRTQKTVETANKFIMIAPEWLKYGCSFLLIAYACYALYKSVSKSGAQY